MRVMATYFSLDDPLFAVHAQVHLARIEVMLDRPRATPVTKTAAVANGRECGASLIVCPIACSWRRGPEHDSEKTNSII